MSASKKVTAHAETVVCLSKEDVDRGSSVRKSAAKNENNGMLSGKGKENREPETTNVKIDLIHKKP